MIAKTTAFLLCFFLASFSFAQNTYEALFLGNSYIYTNDLPSIFQAMTAAGGNTLIKDQNTPGGYTLEGHSTNATSINKINASNWDFVILQEQSQIPSFPQFQVQQMCYPFATRLDSMIQANDHCTETVFFMTWGRKYGDSQNCGTWPPVCTYEGMQMELRTSYLNMANMNDATVAPVGIAWWEAMKRDTVIELYNPDQSHPSYSGSYLAACVLYATLYRESPMGLNYYGSLDSITATFLQEVANDVVFDSLEQWRIGANDVVAGFGYFLPGNGDASFSDSSSNASSWTWDFGDGNTDTVANPLHTYTLPGQYLVTLIATDGCTSDTITDTVNVTITAMSGMKDPGVVVSPNPGSGHFHVSTGSFSAGKAEVFSIDGKLIYSSMTKGNEFEIDLSGHERGVYFLKLTNENSNCLTKLIIQ